MQPRVTRNDMVHFCRAPSPARVAIMPPASELANATWPVSGSFTRVRIAEVNSNSVSYYLLSG